MYYIIFVNHYNKKNTVQFPHQTPPHRAHPIQRVSIQQPRPRPLIPHSTRVYITHSKKGVVHVSQQTNAVSLIAIHGVK